jgi:N-acyl homoserine lactone hydrolase
MKTMTVLAATAVVPVAGVVRSFRSAPLARPTPLPEAMTLPPAHSPGGMQVVALPTGVTHRSSAFAHRGGSFFDRRDFAMTATLIRHPAGDILVDTGFGRNIDEQFHSLPAGLRLVTRYSCWKPAIDLLTDAGYDLDHLVAILPTHTHWDHISGLPDFPGTPVYLTQREFDFFHQRGYGQFRAPLGNIDWRVYDFECGPYLGFERSHDVHGDGSIVCVPAFGWPHPRWRNRVRHPAQRGALRPHRRHRLAARSPRHARRAALDRPLGR